MKKFYSLVLMATALLIGTNAWAAVEVATWAELQTAIATPNAEITLTANITMSTAGGTFDFQNAIIDCNGKRLSATKAKTYTLKNATFNKNTSNYGAIYVSGAATVNLENITATNGKYGVRLSKANAVLNVDASSSLAGTYGVLVTANASINNGGNVKSIYTNAAGVAANIVNNGTLNQTCGSKGVFNLENEGDATITTGTFEAAVSFTGTNPVNILGGTFNLAPTGSNALINPGDGVAKFVQGVGNLTIAPGYVWRNIDKLVAPETGVVEVTHVNGSKVTCLVEEAFANAQNGDKITLIEDVTSYSSCWLGTAEANGAFRSVTLDLNGHTLSSNQAVSNTFELTRGALYIKNSVPGQGGINHLRSNATGKASNIVFVTGSPTRMKKGGAYINPRNADVADLFAYLLVDEGVTMSATGYGVSGICLLENADGNHPAQLNYRDSLYSGANTKWGLAGGIRVDIKGTIDVTKYASKVNGLVRHPNEVIDEAPGTTDVVTADTANGAFLHIYPTAVMHTSDASEAIAVYSSGYARWLIEGLCQGATGVYVKSGVVDLTDAIIESTYTGDASITTGKSSGVDAVGYAVVVESNDHYTGQQAIVIGGDTKISTEANGGAAVVDVVDDTHDSKVESIVINGGTFTGDNAIVISSETASENTTTVNGVTVTGEISVGGSTDPADVAEIMGDNTHTTVVENPDGTTTVVVSAGTAPAAKTEWVDVAALTPGSNANWTGFVPGVIGNGEAATTITLGELQIISGNATDGVQTLTIKDKSTLKVARLIMNDFARIIVEAGGKLIVDGEQGINAPVAENVLLKNENGKRSIFLFHPKVTSNRHPMATVEFVTNSWYDSATSYQWERFGLPTHTALTSITCDKVGTTDVYEEIAVYSSTSGWTSLGYIGGTYTIDVAKLNQPFAAYNMIAFRAQGAGVPTCKMTGELVGNVNADLNVDARWTPFANSYTAELDIAIFSEAIENAALGTDAAIYVATPSGITGHYNWDAIDYDNAGEAGKPTKLQPLQAFILGNPSAAAAVNTIDYKTMVYDPAVPSANPVPRRVAAANDMTAKFYIIATNELGERDNVTLRERTATKEFGKYMNDDINIYAMGEEKAAILAVEDLDNTYVGFSTVKGGKFTLSFANVEGSEFELIDHETGAHVAIVEGNTYEFTAEGENDYRFEIVKPAKMPTAIDNTNAVKSVKGIYTITGQYMGEMNVWNSLPAGVYVVNGEKLVK